LTLNAAMDISGMQVKPFQYQTVSRTVCNVVSG
jgi:hypothetical protein